MVKDRMLDLVAPAAIAAGAIVIFFLVHPAQKLFFAPAMVVAFVCYLLTSYRRMPKAERVLPVYLVALAAQLLHFTEEYVYDFHLRVAEIAPWMPPFDADVFVAFNMIAYCLFLLAGLGLYTGVKFPMVVVWFFAVAGVLGNAVLHPLLALRAGAYFPGLFTSFAYWVIGPVLLARLWDKEGDARGVEEGR